MFNQELADRIIGQIEATPEQWKQDSWGLQGPECGTTHCVAGWACVLSGVELRWQEDDLEDDPGSYFAQYAVNGDSVDCVATQLLGLNYEQSATLFYNFTDNIDDIKELFKEFANEETV